ncbi:response regulator [Cellvibrio japonicus]|uniref:Response regulator receiver domain protein n=1 Tax=Cellvibrio japonicus (strain Ueda107) TaxID=498211 RepID=B3PHD1_CELJU|nr:response regulator [Cellvibrio japonicus]ACE84698.1 Response regulator receiver domain protein [Cellvibrio japonicus Ueda107]QEI11045.1 response regulator [Cellvibrio japonicus]QEI14620.1 response regulator [Cellvibrio japonicus]QEI18199.1 response regulator [Cellvibrio japonicus]
MPIKTALIVDDSTTAQYRLKKMLRPYNLHIDAVDSGEAALRYLASKVPDVIFMDHLMPGMDGFRALQIIKSHPETAMVPVIMYTAKSGDVYTGQARALGALDVVSKDTINATDLSKVMQAIHLYPESSKPAVKGDGIESPELIAAANQVSDMPINDRVTDADYPFIERRAPNQAIIDQARNLELRLSHLEHSLEDNRRVITSRVVRELQGLRQNIRKEFNDVLANAPAVTHTPPASPPPPPDAGSGPPAARSNKGYGVALILVLLLLAVALYYLISMNRHLLDTQAQQQEIRTQLSSLQSPREPDMVSPALQNLARAQQFDAQQYSNRAFLDDLSWAFNQSGAIPFRQNTLDPRSAVRIYEFILRLLDKGFVGAIHLDVFVGDFCLLLDPMGQGELAAPDSTLANCLLSNEAYNLDRIRDNYTRELEDALDNLIRNQDGRLSVSINSYLGPETYPERLPIVSAGDWNAIAQRNNRIEIRLEPLY